MIFRLSVCATFIFYQMVFTAPFTERMEVDKIEATQNSKNLNQWTDIYYDDDVRGGPEYLEYDSAQLYTKNNTDIDRRERNAVINSKQNIAGEGGKSTKTTKDERPVSYLNVDTENPEEIPTKMNDRTLAVEADKANQQVNGNETQNDNIKILDDTDHQTHTLSNTNSYSAKSKASQELYDLTQEVDKEKVDSHETLTADARSTLLPKSQIQFNTPIEKATITKYRDIGNSLGMKHDSVTITANQVKPTQPPLHVPKVITYHGFEISKQVELYSSLDLISNNPKLNTPNEEALKAQSTVYQKDGDKAEYQEDIDKIEKGNSYEAVIQAQLERTERLLRKMEIASSAEIAVHHGLERNSYPAPQESQVTNNEKEGIFREGDTQPSRFTTPIPKDDALDKVLLAQNTSSSNKVWDTTDNTKQQTNERPSIDRVILENNMFKLVQPQQSLSILPTNSLKGKPNRSKGGNSNSYFVTESTYVPQQLGNKVGTGTFNATKLIELPNGSWTPSCKYVTKGKYCLKPDGEGQAIIECSGENVGFQFSCGGTMMCYSTGPHDVDCQNKK